MFGSPGFSKQKLLFAGCCLALALSTGAAEANPLDAIQVVEAALSCPPGTHIGYEGKYCWPNRARICPRGYHLGYEGKYCWADR